MSSELNYIVTLNSTGNTAVILNPDDPSQAYDVAANDGSFVTLDHTSPDQQVVLASGGTAWGLDERQVANIPTSVPIGRTYEVLYFDENDTPLGSKLTTIPGTLNTLDEISAEIDKVGTAAGGALNFAAEGDNITGAIKGVSYIGSETGDYLDTAAADGAYCAVTHVGNAIDIVYQFDIGGGRSAGSMSFKGYLNSSNNSIFIQVYNGSSWNTIGSLVGQNGSDNVTIDLPLLASHTGTGTDLGKVYIRFVCSAQSAPVLYVDQILVQAVNIGQTAGYSGGFLYYNSSASNTNTESFVDGTADKPVSSWSALKTLQSQTNLTKADVVGTLTIDSSAEVFDVIQSHHGTLVIQNAAIGDTEFVDFESVQGTGTTTSTRPVFTNCFIDNLTVPPSYFRDQCGFTSKMTASTGSGHWSFELCRSAVDGTAAPIIDMGGYGGNNIGFTWYARGISLIGLGSNDNVTLHGDMNTVTLSGTNAAINVAGMYGTLATGGLTNCTVTTTNAIAKGDLAVNMASILSDTAELQTDWANGGRLDVILDNASTGTTDVQSNMVRKGVGYPWVTTNGTLTTTIG